MLKVGSPFRLSITKNTGRGIALSWYLRNIKVATRNYRSHTSDISPLKKQIKCYKYATRLRSYRYSECSAN